MGTIPEKEHQKYRITLQYLGTRYHGWQIQSNAVTIQGVLHETLTRIAGKPVPIVGASRTDAGVHALGQVAHFSLPRKDSITDLRKTLNAILPWDIRVIRLSLGSSSFHAQKNALTKLYEYRLFCGDFLPPFLHNRVNHLPRRLDYDALSAGASLIQGRHDFSGFAASSSQAKNRVRTVLSSEVRQKGRFVTYRIRATGFLHHMVRNICGTLIEVGLKRRHPSEITDILKSRDRSMAGPTAAPHGLYLVRIWY